MNKMNPISNIPEYSVSELAFSLKKTLEDTYGRVRVRGELSRVSIAGSGHMYSSLKDDKAVIDAVCWRGTVAKLGFRPEEGLEVICTGKMSSYPARSNYQLIVDSMEIAGEGALLKLIEERKKKLAAEGLFAKERKKSLPYLPDVIGVITSPTGAVIRDILHRLRDRFPRHVLLWPVLVQGEGAAVQITEAIKGFQNIHEKGLPRPDLLIVARGGGALEDLLPFSEENVVRAVAESAIPVISAVGHETDTMLIDYVADYRAPTPTGAAEVAVPRRVDLSGYLKDQQMRFEKSINRNVDEKSKALDSLIRHFGDPSKLFELRMQQLDHYQEKITHVFQHFIVKKSNHLLHVASALKEPKWLINKNRESLRYLEERLSNYKEGFLNNYKKELGNLSHRLEVNSFEQVLKRGFTVVQTENGSVVSDVHSLETNENITIRFAKDDSITAKVEKINLKSKKLL